MPEWERAMPDEKTNPEANPQADPPETPPEAPTIESLSGEVAKWKAFSRKHEDAAKQNAAAAKRLQEIEDLAKTAEQKAAEELAEAKNAAQTASQKLMRYEVAADKGVPPQLLAGSTKEELEASADAAIQWRGEQPQPQLVPNLRQGNQGVPAADDVNSRLRRMAGQGR